MLTRMLTRNTGKTASDRNTPHQHHPPAHPTTSDRHTPANLPHPTAGRRPRIADLRKRYRPPHISGAEPGGRRGREGERGEEAEGEGGEGKEDGGQVGRAKSKVNQSACEQVGDTSASDERARRDETSVGHSGWLGIVG